MYNETHLVAESIINELPDNSEDAVPASAVGFHYVSAQSIMVSFSATQGPMPNHEWDAL